MVKFHCKNCGQKISVPEIHTGKKGKCPNCKSIVVVPKMKAVDSLNDKKNLPMDPSSLLSDLQLKKEPPRQTEKINKVFANGFGLRNTMKGS